MSPHLSRFTGPALVLLVAILAVHTLALRPAWSISTRPPAPQLPERFALARSSTTAGRCRSILDIIAGGGPGLRPGQPSPTGHYQLRFTLAETTGSPDLSADLRRFERESQFLGLDSSASGPVLRNLVGTRPPVEFRPEGPMRSRWICRSGDLTVILFPNDRFGQGLFLARLENRAAGVGSYHAKGGW